MSSLQPPRKIKEHTRRMKNHGSGVGVKTAQSRELFFRSRLFCSIEVAKTREWKKCEFVPFFQKRIASFFCKSLHRAIRANIKKTNIRRPDQVYDSRGRISRGKRKRDITCTYDAHSEGIVRNRIYSSKESMRFRGSIARYEGNVPATARIPTAAWGACTSSPDAPMCFETMVPALITAE